MARGQQKI
uniref:Zinc finger protein 706 n=2 Tax=Catarrhini TaxID=9526 RepID=H9FMV0_MACMU